MPSVTASAFIKPQDIAAALLSQITARERLAFARFLILSTDDPALFSDVSELARDAETHALRLTRKGL